MDVKRSGELAKWAARRSPVIGGALQVTGGHLSALDEIRDRAASRLEAIAAAHGTGSVFHSKCLSLWDRREEEAWTSLVHGDFENAAVVLEKGLEALERGPEALEREELTVTEVLRLMGAA